MLACGHAECQEGSLEGRVNGPDASELVVILNYIIFLLCDAENHGNCFVC